MNRFARVVARSNHSVLLNLLPTKKCAGCPSNCNKPLFKLFTLRDNLFTLSTSNSNYELIADQGIFTNEGILGQTINLHIETQDLLKSSAMMYFIPLLICMTSLTLGHLLGSWFELSTDLTSFLGLVFGFVVIYLLFAQEVINKHLKFRPKVTIL